MKNRILAGVLAFCLVFTSLPGKALAASNAWQLGDTDQSGDISANDVAQVNLYASGSFQPDDEALFRVAADLNCDGNVDQTDIDLLKQVCIESITSPGYYGACGTGVYWQLSGGVLHIRGTGEMEDFGYQADPPWYGERNTITSVSIDYGVTRIGMYAFGECANMTGISIPESVTAISAGALRNCGKLRSVTFPSGVTKLENQIFQGCTSLTGVNVSSRVNSIGEYAFSGCTGLTSYTVPEAVGKIGMFAFDNCTGLRRVSIPESTVEIENTAFLDCSSLTQIDVAEGNTAYRSVDGVLFTKDGSEIVRYPAGKAQGVYTVPGGTVRVGQWAFSGARNLTGVTLPDTLQWINSVAFDGCTALTGIVIPEGVTKLDYMQFAGCTALASVTLPVSMTEVGYRVFDGCGVLKDVYYRGSAEQWKQVSVSSASGTITSANVHCLATAGSYTVTFDANGGSVEVQSKRVTNGAVYGDLPTPALALNEFSGWYTAAQGGQQITSQTVVALSADQTLYAHWKPALLPPVLVTYDPNGGQWYGGVLQTFQQKTPGTDLTLGHSALQRPGYTLAGWSTTAAGPVEYRAGDVYTKDENLALFAVWTPATFRVVFSPNGGTVTPEEKNVTYDSTYGELPVPTREGYVFEGWYTAEEGGELVTAASVVKVTPEQSILGQVDPHLYAHWKQPVVSIPQVATGAAVDITASGAALHGLILSDGGSPVTSRRFFYFEKNTPSVLYQVVADSAFTVVLDNLKPETEYWFYALAQNAKGTGFGEPGSFVTLQKEVPTPTSVSLLPAAGLVMSVGQMGRLTAQVLPENLPNPGVVWESSDPTVASVTQAGSVTALKEGSTTITVTTEVGRLKASCPVKVRTQPLEIDLSEWNMTTNTSSSDPDGWSTQSESGNVQRALAYLSRWDGPVYEEDDPYGQGGYRECAPVYHIQDAQFLRKRSGPLDNDEIKGALVRYGAVSASLLYDNTCYEPRTHSYYNPGILRDGGHAVTIVGWDDNYSADNFRQRPGGNGAFLCKNSYGRDYGDSGYFWVSYYDAQFAIRNITAVFNCVETTDNYSRLYQHDPTGPVGCIFPSNAFSVYEANIFPCAGTGLDQAENLQAVSFYTYDKGTRYEVYIVSNWQDASSFQSLGEPQEVGTLEYAGYHTVRLSEPVRLEAGTRFAVVVRLTNSQSGAALYIEAPINSINTTHTLNARANAGESWISRDGVLWTDLTKYNGEGNIVYENANFCIKAFTDGTPSSQDGSRQAASLLEEEEIPSLEDCLAAGVMLSEEYVEAAGRPGLYSDEEEGDILASIPVGSSTLDFLDGVQYPASFDLRTSGDMSGVRDQGSHNTCWAHAVFASMESCWLRAAKAAQADGGLDGGITIGNLGTNAGVMLGAGVGSSLSFQLNAYEKQLAPGASAQLIASVSGMNISVQWATSAPDVAQVDTSGLVTALQPGNAVITAAAANGRTAACTVTVRSAGAAGIELSKTAVSCRAGETLLLDYEAVPAGTTVRWSSSAPEVATVDPLTGRITARTFGSALITASAAGGGGASCTVTVTGQALFTASGSCAVSAAGRCSARVIVENPRDEAASVRAVLAVYDGNGKLCTVRSTDVTLPPGETAVSFTDVPCSSVSAGWRAKFFLLSNQTGAPLSAAAELRH